MSDPPELESQAIENCPIWGLETELESSERIARILKC